jgi:hypothetical protein
MNAMQPPAPAATGPTGGAAPFYQNEAPTFTLPGSGGSVLSPSSAPLTYTKPGGGGTTGGSAPLTPEQSRSLASALGAGKISGGGGGGNGDGSAANKGLDAADAAGDKAEKSTKEALSSFEMPLTGGVRAYTGSGAPAAAGKDEVPNPAAGMDPSSPNSAATGISPAQIFQAAEEGTDGTEEGSMSGVSGKSGVSLFEITTAKLTKMFQTGNVGIPKNVEVKN